MRDLREKTPDHLQTELGLSHMTLGPLARLEPTDVRWRALKISILNHTATGAPHSNMYLSLSGTQNLICSVY